MTASRASRHDTCKSVLYTLKLVNVLCTGAVQQRVAVVNPGSDDAACHGISHLSVECRSDMPQGSDMKVTRFHDTCDMIIKRQALIYCHTQALELDLSLIHISEPTRL